LEQALEESREKGRGKKREQLFKGEGGEATCYCNFAAGAGLLRKRRKEIRTHTNGERRHRQFLSKERETKRRGAHFLYFEPRTIYFLSKIWGYKGTVNNHDGERARWREGSIRHLSVERENEMAVSIRKSEKDFQAGKTKNW